MTVLDPTSVPVNLTSLLEGFSCWESLENLTGINRKYWRIGTLGLLVSLAVAHFAGSILIGLLSWVYPAYASFKALEAPSRKDDKRWLIYWTVTAFIHTGVSIVDQILFWVPFYSLLKLVFFIWLTMPWFGGAELLYGQIVRPWLVWAEKDVDERAEVLRQQLGHAATNVAHQLLHTKSHASAQKSK
ncbi:TB2/DP1, HVA22 family-domain-containing protein [Phycomyces blakesleeanus]|uniref:Protein YOP1 n=1 Tax=Phycomyces blakesleeanus TaxID=4837 RepID=A0ABR3AIL1_PHYBL